MVFVDELAIAIATFDPAYVLGDLQPDTRVAQGPFAAVTGNAIGVDDFCLRGLLHLCILALAAGFMAKVQHRGKPKTLLQISFAKGLQMRTKHEYTDALPCLLN
jgi:hypothetical protein